MLLVCTWLYSFVLVCTWLYLVVLGPGWLQIAVVTGAVVQPSKQGKGEEGRRKADVQPTNQESNKAGNGGKKYKNRRKQPFSFSLTT